ncbi:MAG TPA: EAL domain-containing protein [Solirubrobacteraceae bacterium]|nr:EAL domain-containing protein [Solirubrobacteraceae bacterium]
MAPADLIAPAPAGGGLACRARALLPRGRTLPEAEWDSRHRVMLWLLWLHVVGLPVFLLCQGFGVWGSISPVLPIALAGLVARRADIGRRARSVAVVFGLLTASAVLVYGWHGQIEAHFHYFVVIAVLALYEDWLPFGLAFLYVGLEHGVLGALAPHDVYSHGGNPWGWAAVHASFVLAAGAAAVATWRLNENTRERAVAAMRAADRLAEQFKAAFESGISGMCMVEPGGRYLRVNTALCQMLGYSEAELLARSFAELIEPDELPASRRTLERLVAGELDVYEGERRYRHRDGHTVWVQHGVRAIRDASGRLDYLLVQANDITGRKLAEQELKHTALHDPLTGIANRRLLLDRTAQALRRLTRDPTPLAILFVDLDRFKLVNDELGHAAGDAVLCETATRLGRVVRSQDTVARMGGDEFTVLCERTDEASARLLADRILRVLSTPFEHQGRLFRLGASVGVRIEDSPHVPPATLLHDADVAMYAAKEAGRGRVWVFDSALERSAVAALATEHELRTAIADGQLRLHYQPEVSLVSGAVAAVEALVRWEHPVRGLVAPGQFIGVAEQSDLIVELGAWVLREACGQLVRWRREGACPADLRVAVNVSPRQLADPRFPMTVAETLRETGLDPRALCLEITERSLVRDVAVGLANLRALGELAVTIAIDDFGVGFSSLDRLRELPALDVIKIDRSFVSGMQANTADAAVVGAVLSLGAHLGVTVVAEGVEDPRQADALRALGCDLAQGYLLARPAAPEQLLATLGRDWSVPAAGAAKTSAQEAIRL